MRKQQHVEMTTASTKPDILTGIEQPTMSMTMLCSGYRSANVLGSSGPPMEARPGSSAAADQEIPPEISPRLSV